MNDMTPVLANTPSLIPESAPFSDEQRAWLNGFFSGFIALERAAVNGVAAHPFACARRRYPDGSGR